MTEAQLEDVLNDDTAANVPQRLPGHSGPKTRLSTEDARERRAAMSVALANGIPRDAIVTSFSKRYRVTEHEVLRIMQEVRAMWDDEDVEYARYAKGAATRRLRRHITEAAKDRKWTAVANLEKVMSEVEGTSVDDEDKPVDVDSRLTDAILGVLGAQETSEVRIMIERQRAFIELGSKDGTITVESTALDVPVE